MLQKLLTYGTFLVREGADIAAAGTLLGCVDTLGRKGTEQEILDAVSGRVLAFMWVYDGLKGLENAESIFGALRALQAWNWLRRLLLEELEGPCGEEKLEHLSCLLNKISISQYVSELKVSNIGTTVRLAESLISSVQTSPRETVLLEKFQYIMRGLRQFESTRCAVPLGPTAFLYQEHAASDFHICHHATMTGAALGPAVGEMKEALRIINPSGVPAFATFRHVDAARGNNYIQLWRFTPRASRDAAKPQTDIRHFHDCWFKDDERTPLDFYAGALHGGCLWLPSFCSAAEGYAVGFDVDVASERPPQIEAWSAGELEDRQGASIVACGDLLIAFGGSSGRQVAPTWHRGVSVLDMRSGSKGWAPQMTGCSFPPPRRAHCAWMVGHHMYVFGGVGLESLGSARARRHGDGMSTRGMSTMNDLWRLDTLAWTWEEVHAVGVHPCRRSHAGVATDGKRVFIVGGKALALTDRTKKENLLLADIFEFHTEENCWIQVMPGAGVKAWMSARHSPACALLDSGHLAVMGGFDAMDQPIGMEACLTFNITRCDLAAVMKCVSFPEKTSRRPGEDLEKTSRRL
ncbi:probable f-box only protein 42 at C-terminar half [Coccomyxa sp. Obi]|nr:probable f-box only protein 42 at C-terminar half [Coccomyxa sp. Obi]